MTQLKNPFFLIAIAFGSALAGIMFWYFVSFNAPGEEVSQPQQVRMPTEAPTIIPPTSPPPETTNVQEPVDTEILGDETPPPSPTPLAPPEPLPYATPYPTPPPQPQPKTYAVSLTSTGFEPSVLTISLGDTVRFVNNDNKAHWPASDKHPAHLDYQQFDPLQGIQPGASWSFTFERVGDWGMHDHIYPGVRGKITVE